VRAVPKSRPTRAAASSALIFLLLAIAACSSPPEAPPEAPPEPAPAPVPEAPAATPSPPATGDIARFGAAADYSAAHEGHVLLILHGDQVAYEAGQNGHLPDEIHRLNNASESFWGVLGVAADSDGLLDLDEPVTFTLPEFKNDIHKRELRVRHLLDFTSGIEPGVAVLQIDRTPNLNKRALALGTVSPPGTDFQYGPSHLFVFSEILRRKLEPQKLDALAYLKDRLLDPIGLRVAAWDRDQAGNPDVAFGASLTAREWAKLGTLLNDDGLWGDETIIEAGDLRAAFTNRAATPEFAFTMWRNVVDTGARSVRIRTFYPGSVPSLLVAAGVGNQRLYVLPSQDLVVVRFGGDDRGWRDQDFLKKLLAPQAP
jgi:CubicO group peptidase (beta-lactamase class C family)